MTDNISFHGSSSDLETADGVLSDDCIIPETPDLEMDFNTNLISLGAFKRKKQNSESDQETGSENSKHPSRPRKNPNMRDSPKSPLTLPSG